MANHRHCGTVHLLEHDRAVRMDPFVRSGYFAHLLSDRIPDYRLRGARLRRLDTPTDTHKESSFVGDTITPRDHHAQRAERGQPGYTGTARRRALPIRRAHRRRRGRGGGAFRGGDWIDRVQQLGVRRRYGFFTQATHVRGPARTAWIAAWLQFAKRPARAVVTPAACRRRESDHRRFHRGSDSAGGRDGKGRQKAHAEDLAQRRAGRRLSLVRCRQ